MTIIRDARTQASASVDDTFRLLTRSVTESESQSATEEGDAFNLNTGIIALSSSTESAIAYYQHNEESAFIIETIVVGVGSAGTTTDVSTVTLIRNPTAGTIISGASAGDILQNRNFGSSKTLGASTFLKGAEGNTITGGDDFALFFQSAGGRLAAPLNIELNKGDSIGVKVDTNTTSGSTNVYSAIIGHLKAGV